MGNLKCCYKKQDQKRGGANLKTMLRKTEKPGKGRKRIDDLVADALKREKRDERQKKKRERKEGVSYKNAEGHLHSVDSKTKENKIQDQTFDGDESMGNNQNGVGQSVYTTDSIRRTVSEANTSTIYQKIGLFTETNLNTDSVYEHSNGCSVHEFDRADHNKSESRPNTDQNTEVDILEKCTDYDSKELNTVSREEELRIVLSDVETINVIDHDVSRNKLTKPLETDGNFENSCIYNDDNLNTERVNAEENRTNQDEANSAEDSASNHGSELYAETKTENDDPCNNYQISPVSSMDYDEEKLSDICDNEGEDLHGKNELAGDELQNGNCDQIKNPPDIPEKDINDYIVGTTRNHCRDNPGCHNNKSTNDDNKTTKILKVHDETVLKPRGGKNAEVMDDCNTKNILKVFDTNSFTGYDDTKLKQEDVDEESNRDDQALKPIQRSKSMSLKRCGSVNDLRTTRRTPADSSKDNKSLKNQLNRLKRIYALSKTRGIEKKNHIQRTSVKRSAMKCEITNPAINGGQKPQIKEIIRLKKDPFNFSPKIRQFTERDRQGSIADLKWSRYMRAEVRRHIAMESTEFEKLMFINDEEHTDDFEFDVCDESCAPTPVPGYDKSRAPTPVPGYDEPRAPTPVPGYDAVHAPNPVTDFPRATSPYCRYDPRRTNNSKNVETMKNLRERYGADRVGYTRYNTPYTSRLTASSRHSTPNNTKCRLNTPAADRKKAAFQTIVRQFEKSFKDAGALRSKETKGHSMNQTSCIGIGRQTSFMNLGDDTSGTDN